MTYMASIPKSDAIADRHLGIDGHCARYIPMPRIDECELVRRAQAGCYRSRNRLINHNLGYVIACVKRRFPNHDRRDLLGTAAMAMAEAINHFDTSVGTRLCNYVSLRINQYCHRQVHDEHNTIREPHSHPRRRNAVLERIAETGESWREAGEALGWKQGEMTTMARHYDSYERVVSAEGDDGDNSRLYAEVLADDRVRLPDAEMVKREVKASVFALVDSLRDAKHREIIRRRFGLVNGVCETLTAIAQDWGCTRENIRQKELRAIAKLRQACRRHGISPSDLLAFEN